MVGTTLSDRYVLYDRLATGGMGTVFRATDNRLHREVAVKVLKEEFVDDPRFVERFRREARAAAALSHPNIAGIFDYGEDGGGHFIVMELVKGRDLARLLREEGPLSEDRCVWIGAQIAEALGHAHEAGLIHRDIKPGNVIIDANEHVKVTDFGIARAQADSTLTATGAVMGTAQYISPEQAAGERVGHATDIYSLGIVLYEMVTGSVPFTGDSAIAVAMRHLREEVPAPSIMHPEIDPQLDAVIKRATAKEPKERFRTAGELGVALNALSNQEAPQAAPPPTTPIAGAATTAVIGSKTEEIGEDTWPFPGHPSPWDPRKLGRTVIAIFAILIAIASGLLLYRLATSDDTKERAGGKQQGQQGGAAAQETEQTTTPAGFLLDDYSGGNVHDVEKVLKEGGFNVEKEDIETSDYENDTVLYTQPEAGTAVPPGGTVTLYVAKTPKDEEGDEEDEFVPPGQEKKEEKHGDD